jgi:starch synthase
MARKLQIGIATLGRFWLLDLARELSALGHDVRFYSYVPRRRARRFGLPDKCHVSLLTYLWPFIALCSLAARTPLDQHATRLLYWAANWVVRLRVKPCDVFIGISGLYVEASLSIRQKHRALIVAERGSRHILSQQAILDEISKISPNCARVPDWIVSRELVHYDLADLVAVPSEQVEESFVSEGVSLDKLFRNPYGVDLSMFRRQPCVTPFARPTFLFTGAWSYRKGADLVTRAMELLPNDVQLVHVGPRGDAPMPTCPWFRSVGAVEQWQLSDWYSRVTALVLPSREEGLALVQIQALACGCPIVVSERTGGADLRKYLDIPNIIDVVPSDDVEALASAMRRQLEHERTTADSDIIRARLAEVLAWSSYGQRYSDRLQRLASGLEAPVASPLLAAGV